MNRSTGPTYTRYRCCIGESCEPFDSFLAISECYERGGHLARPSSESSSRSSEPRSSSRDVSS